MFNPETTQLFLVINEILKDLLESNFKMSAVDILYGEGHRITGVTGQESRFSFWRLAIGNVLIISV